jgi:hypothetical protein
MALNKQTSAALEILLGPDHLPVMAQSGKKWDDSSDQFQFIAEACSWYKY